MVQSLKRGSPRDEVYHRLLLNTVGTTHSRRRAEPEEFAEYIHAIDDEIEYGGSKLLGRSIEARKSMLEVARLAYRCMKRHGVMMRSTEAVVADGALKFGEFFPGTLNSVIADDRVRKAIDEERDYQDGLGADRTDGVARTLADYFVMLKYYRNKMIEGWTMNPGIEGACDVIRKIAGIGVHALEDWGIQSL
jgi:hypothetical protein